MNKSKKHSYGFTFIELLATIVLIALIMPVAMEVISLCTRLAGESRHKMEAAALARSKITELVVSEEWQSSGQGGDFGSEWPEYQWTSMVTNWTDSIVSKLDVTVSWDIQETERSITLSTLVYPEEE